MSSAPAAGGVAERAGPITEELNEKGADVRWLPVTSTDWASYPILTFPEIPEICHRPDRSTEYAAMGCWRAICCRGALGDLQRGV